MPLKGARMSLPFIKWMLRSGSMSFALNRKKYHSEYGEYRYSGRPIYYRPGSSDMWLIHDILLKKGPKGEYWLPRLGGEPEVILDIGGNIGITSIYFANRYPNAKIYTFEPVRENFHILEKNVAMYENIKAYNYGLGRENQELVLHYSSDANNFGGFSLHSKGVDAEKKCAIIIRKAAEVLSELYITSPDIVKIDTEGHEWPILESMMDAVAGAQWVVGELHGIDDYKVLEMLSNKFEIKQHKCIGKELSMFFACNKEIVKTMHSKDLKILNSKT